MLTMFESRFGEFSSLSILFAGDLGGNGGGSTLTGWESGPDLGAAAVKIFVSLLILSGLLLLLSHYLRRSHLPGTSWRGREGFLKVLSTVPLGDKRYLALVSAGKELLLLGVTAENINLLEKFGKEVLEEDCLTAANNRARSIFPKLLGKSLLKKGSLKELSESNPSTIES